METKELHNEYILLVNNKEEEKVLGDFVEYGRALEKEEPGKGQNMAREFFDRAEFNLSAYLTLDFLVKNIELKYKFSLKETKLTNIENKYTEQDMIDFAEYLVDQACGDKPINYTPQHIKEWEDEKHKA